MQGKFWKQDLICQNSLKLEMAKKQIYMATPNEMDM